MVETMRQALAEFRSAPEAAGWCSLPFFQDGTAERLARRIDALRNEGAHIVPTLPNVFAALRETPLERVKVVILGQDPYPTPGDAHGLAFSYIGGRRLPMSLRTILAEMAADMGGEPPMTGDLTSWARQGALLLNTALTTEAGRSGAHLKLGWDRLTDEAVAAVSRERQAVAFLLWGAPARARAALIDRDRHLVLECGHPSPLNRNRDFRGCGHFRKANEWLAGRGEAPIDWRLPLGGSAS